MSNENQNKCDFCSKSNPNYCCPRCNKKYCCSQCYRHPNHQQCSESFYKEWVMQSLQSESSSNESKRKMLEILKRHSNVDDVNDIENLVREQNKVDENEDEDDDNNDDDNNENKCEDDLETRLKGLDIESDECDFNDIWERLNDREKNEFMQMVQTGNYPKVFQCGNSLISLDDE